VNKPAKRFVDGFSDTLPDVGTFGTDYSGSVKSSVVERKTKKYVMIM